jgi:hypothetical protein
MGNVTFTGGGGTTKTVTGTGVGFTLTVTKAGSGSGTVTSSPTGINCGTDCSQDYADSTPVTLTANPVADSLFTGWSGGGCTGTGVCMLTVNANTSVTATFNKIPRTLTVTKAGVGSGTVTSNPSGITCGSTCSASFDSGTSVTLTANPAAGSTFAGFSGGGCSGTGPCTVIVNANTTITATFDSLGTSFTFTDDPLTSQVTLVKAVHITELRQAINTLRSRNGLSAFAFTDPTLIAGFSPIRAVHITELRTALNGVFDALGQTRPIYTDPTIVAGQRVVKKVHIEEIRSAVVEAELPDIRGTYIGSATITLDCRRAALDGTFSFSSSVTISTQTGPNFTGSATLTGFVMFNISLSGTVTAEGELSGTFTFTISGVSNSSGNGTFTGSGVGDSFMVNLSGQSTSGEICTFSGPMSGTR